MNKKEVKSKMSITRTLKDIISSSSTLKERVINQNNFDEECGCPENIGTPTKCECSEEEK